MYKIMLGMMAFLMSGSLFAQNLLAIPDTAVGPVINLNMAPSSVNFYSTPTQTMGFNGDILGPTLLLNQGDSVTINVTNNLPNTTTVHWHGLHVSPENDGGPHSIITPGATWTKSIEVMDHAATYWYHPHLHMHTNEHVTKGLAGFIIVRDADEAVLALPRTYGVDDIPLVIQTRHFDASNQFMWETAWDTAILVNGTRDPYVDLPAQVVRLRLLNGSSERVYNYGFSDNRSFHVITSDGGLLAAPVSMTRLRLAPGERAEILVDLQGGSGQTIHLRNYGSTLPNAIYGASQPGMGMGQTIPNYTSNPLNGGDYDILEIRIIAPTAGAITAIPATLVNVTPWLEANADTTRTLTFTPAAMGPNALQGPFRINGTTFDMNVINQTIPLGNTEIWTLTNQSPIAHPFHIHDVQFYVLDKNGAIPPAHERGRKDVILVEAMSTVRFITRFEDFASDTMPYMYHCHMLTHEDDGMMHQFLVVDTLTTGIQATEIAAIPVTIFPNPVREGRFTVRFDMPVVEKGNLTLFDVSGRVVLMREIGAGDSEVELNISGASRGTYILQVDFPGGKVVRKVEWVD